MAEPRSPRQEEEDRDLGFGTVVSTRARRRLLNRDGSFNVVRQGRGLRSTLSLYQLLLHMSWPRFLTLVAIVYLLINLTFAVAYSAVGPDALSGPYPVEGSIGRFGQAFFFSVQTFSTVGYGSISPVSLPANTLMTAQSIVGLLTVALVTGLVFARFSRPIADIVYSREAIVAPYRDGRGLMIRIANRRRSQIADLSAKVVYSARERDGVKREFHELELERSMVTFFPLAWTIVHPIDRASPLDGLTMEEIVARDVEILIMLTGVDETFSQTVMSRSSYKADEIAWGVRFSDIFEGQSPGHLLGIDLRRIHDTEPARLPLSDGGS